MSNNMKNAGIAGPTNVPKIPITKWWTKGTPKQQVMYAVGVSTLVLVCVSSVFMIIKSIVGVESKNTMANKYMEDRKQANYVTDEEYEKRSKSSDIGLTYKASENSKDQQNILKKSVNRCAMYDKMITDSKDPQITKSLCREANLEYCALPIKCNHNSSSKSTAASVTNQLLMVTMFVFIGVGFFMLMNKAKKDQPKNNKPKGNNKKNINKMLYYPPRMSQPSYGGYGPYNYNYMY